MEEGKVMLFFINLKALSSKPQQTFRHVTTDGNITDRPPTDWNERYLFDKTLSLNYFTNLLGK